MKEKVSQEMAKHITKNSTADCLVMFYKFCDEQTANTLCRKVLKLLEAKLHF